MTKEIVEKTFCDSKELYMWLKDTDMNVLKEEMTKKHGKNKAHINTDTNELIIVVIED